MSARKPNALGIRVRDSLLGKHPDWAQYVEILESEDIEIAVPAPRHSRAKHLVVLTARGEDIWIRFAPRRMAYAVDSADEMHAVIDALLRDDAFFVVVTQGDDWMETSLLRPGEDPVLAEGQVANVVSWSGHHDRIVTYTARQSPAGS